MRNDDWLVEQLPMVMGDDEFFKQFLRIFQSVADTVFDQIDSLSSAFDPTVAPASMVRLMGRWLGVDWLDASDSDELQRKIVIAYATLLPWRGTVYGLTQLLVLISGDENAEVRDTGGVYAKCECSPKDPHVQMSIASTDWASPDLVVRILQSELPANVTFELKIADTVAWPRVLTSQSEPHGAV